MSTDAQLPSSLVSRWRVRIVLALVCLLALAGVWATAWHADQRERENHIDDLATRVRTSANAYALAIGARLRMVDQMLLYAAADYERDQSRFDAQFWLGRLPSLHALGPRLSFADRDGVVRVSSAGTAALGRPIADQGHIDAHRYLDTRLLHIGRVADAPAAGRRTIEFSRRVNGPNGLFGGILIFTVDADFFLDIIDRMKVGIEGGGAVRREGGAAIVRVTNAGREVGHKGYTGEGLRYESADAAAFGFLYDAEVVRASRGIEDYDDLIVDAEGNVAEALAEIQQRRSLIWLAAAVLTIAIVGLFLALTSDLTRLGRLRAILERRNRELLQANRTAHAAVEAKSRFLANMSHEFRTPLNAILGFSEALKSGLFGKLNPRQQDYAGHIHSSGGHLLALINDVLDISRLDLDAYVLHPERLDVAGLIAGATRTLSVAAEQKGVALASAVTPGLPELMADERAVKQVLLNLLSNAVKFTPAGGTVSLSAEALSDGALAVTVADTGAGIAPADLARLFQPFQQADQTRRANAEGTGLGLVISRRLMEKHGGTLSLESTLGQGTRAIAVFPKESVAHPLKQAAERFERRQAVLAA